jgi:hypothetical protein
VHLENISPAPVELLKNSTVQGLLWEYAHFTKEKDDGPWDFTCQTVTAAVRHLQTSLQKAMTSTCTPLTDAYSATRDLPAYSKEDHMKTADRWPMAADKVKKEKSLEPWGIKPASHLHGRHASLLANLNLQVAENDAILDLLTRSSTCHQVRYTSRTHTD